MTKKFKDRMTKKEEKKLIVSRSRFWLLHNQDWALDILCTMIAHTPKESPASPTNNVLKKTIKQQIREYPISKIFSSFNFLIKINFFCSFFLKF